MPLQRLVASLKFVIRTSKYYKSSIASFANRTSYFWHQGAKINSSNEYALAGFTPQNIYNQQQLTELYNKLVVGDEIMFFDIEKQAWRNLVYVDQMSTVRKFDEISNRIHEYGQFPKISFTPNELFKIIKPGSLTLRVRTTPPPAGPQVNPEIYPTLSIAMVEQDKQVDEAHDLVNKEISRLGQGMRGMSDHGAATTVRRINDMVLSMATIEVQGLNARRRMELSSIRAVRGLGYSVPFNPDLISYQSHEEDVIPLEPTLIGKDLKIDIFKSPGKAEEKSLSISRTDKEIIYSINVSNLQEARMIFAQIMESAYGAILSNRYLWSIGITNNTF